MQTIMNWIFSGKVLLEDPLEGDIERLAKRIMKVSNIVLLFSTLFLLNIFENYPCYYNLLL